MKFNKHLQKFLFPVLLILITGVLVWKNYVPGTILSGWDTLHPEFNLGLYLKRAFFGVWQEHQGVGAVASQAHIAEIPRLLIVFLLSLILPLSAVRYVFFFLCLGLGALGIYYFSKYLLAITKRHYLGSSAFLAALFYVLNLTTLQHFYVPLEMFAIHFAALPWLFLLTVLYLRQGKGKFLIWFSLATLFAAGMAHTATLFYVYLGALVVYIALLSLIKGRRVFKRGIVIVFLTLLLNSFWLLPNLYFIVNHSKEVTSSRIHRIFSDEAFLQGKSFGDIESLALSKNFLFNWREFNTGENTFVDLMDEWKTHLNKPGIEIVGYTLFGLAVSGSIISMFGGSGYSFSLLPLLAVAVFFWINANPPFESLFNLLRDNLALFKEGLRFSFTKISILLIFTLATYFSFFAQFVLEKLKKIKLSVSCFFIICASLIYFSLPAFEGYLISPSMKVEIPNEYFEVFEWFNKKDPTARIAKLPLHSLWGWQFNSWGYQGAGFTWFGLTQPTLDREFDRWSPYNESFYNEASFALYSDDLEGLENTLGKYQVNYLLLDESILNAGGLAEILRINEIKRMLTESSHTKIVQEFGFLSIYETDFGQNKNYLSTPKSYVLVDGDTKYSEKNAIYVENGVYVEDKEGLTYPYANFDRRAGIDVEIEEDNVVFYSLPLDFSGTKKLVISDNSGAVKIELNNEKRVKTSVAIDEKIEEDFSLRRGFDAGYNCDLKKIGSVSKENDGDKITYKAFDGGVSCDFFSYPGLSYSQGYVLRISGENTEGRSLKFYLQNTKTKRMDLEELLPEGKFNETFVILPKDIDGSGYTLNLETRSYGRVSSENILERIELIPVPISVLQSIKLVPDSYSNVGNDIEILESQKVGTGYYNLKTNSKEGLIVLGQGYESGWLGFGFEEDDINVFNKVFPWFSGDYLKHVKVNSWANGWFATEGNQRLIFVFWPQYLEYFGIAISVIGLIWLYNKKGKSDLAVDKGKSLKLK
ncbi:hypothetical protein KKH23_02805 [Patescibacteria group bacterium]|nr:hypothetical protein [Patescibacteria group bacterium]MBU0777324.1 hypothetical protein [Patescibacteria group bacterium]MBU0846096.1 hypothetical protein [Patescibacteria group bacterium]MBU0923149.1 hypothetical protein [Patescibacteria group bacterium]MBU1066864.1 hypothetical protein [Patescibacteria group bacterium]